MQPGDIASEGILAYIAERLKDAAAIPLGDALKLFFG